MSPRTAPIQPIITETERAVRRLKIVAATLALTFTVLTALRFSVEHPTMLQIFGAVIAIGGCVITWGLAPIHNRPNLGGSIVVASLLISFSIVVYLGGGVTAPVAVLGPMVPIVATVLISPLQGLVALIITIIIYATLAALQLSSHAMPVTNLSDQADVVVRSMFVIAGTILATGVALYDQLDSSAGRRQLRRLANRDPLTNAFNRRGYDAILAREISSAARNRHPLAILMIDVDNFKTYNDVYGHPAGDECLRKLAQLIRDQLLRPRDVLARVGGDEFVAILPDTSGEAARTPLQKIEQSVFDANIRCPAGLSDRITVSIGIGSMEGAEPVSAAHLLKTADNALLEAKKRRHEGGVQRDLASLG